MQFSVLISDGYTNYKHFFSAQNAITAKSVISLKTPLKHTAIDKYFAEESDMARITESLLEKPTVFTFDAVYKSSQYICHNQTCFPL